MVESNTEEEILEELRSIRALLMMDRQDQLKGLGESLNDDQLAILEELSYDDWIKSANIKDEITEEIEISGRTFNRRINVLEEKGLIEKEGQTRDTKYRKTGLLRMVQTLADL